GGRLPAEALRHLAASPHLAGLKELDLYDLALPKALLQALRRAPWRLEILNLGCEDAGPADVGPLLASPVVECLQELQLRDRRVGINAAQGIAENPLLRHLRLLGLEGCEIDDQALALLAEAAHLSNLADLDLSRNRIGSAGVRALVAAP